MFVFRDDFIKAERCGQCDGYCHEYRNPIDYGHEHNHQHECRDEHNYEHKHEHKKEQRHEHKTHTPPKHKLAEAYVPFQKCDGMYPPCEGLEKGTIFPQLYRPYEKKRCGGMYHHTELAEAKTDVEIEG